MQSRKAVYPGNHKGSQSICTPPSSLASTLMVLLVRVKAEGMAPHHIPHLNESIDQKHTAFPCTSTDHAMRGHDWINTCFPDDLIVEIFSRLHSMSTRDACSLVCRRWFRLQRLTRTTLRIASTHLSSLHRLPTRFSNLRNLYIDQSLSIPLHLVRPIILLPFLHLNFNSNFIFSSPGENATELRRGRS